MHLGREVKSFISYSGLTCHLTGRFLLLFLQFTCSIYIKYATGTLSVGCTTDKLDTAVGHACS
ncbi:hypothetical protein EXN66_Car000467 [Channa argus]|uniref:Uncharacterized protein n=1 Tax=Channa argus TaxID=215402 RepID=A0A6G1QXR4_CHAAH|nr:hypothetical protein EXN66_Car000467 [Channa argus]